MLILFDIDDTLIDHTAAVRHGVTALHATLASPPELSVLLGSWTDAMRQHFPRYLRGETSYEEQRRARMRQTIDASLSDAHADTIFATYFSAYESAWSLFPDAIPCLDALAGHRLGIISNGNGNEQRSKLARTGIAHRFASVHISNDCGYAKPAVEIFHQACRDAGVVPSDAVYIGDFYEADAIGSRQAGLRGVWLDRTQSRTDAHAPPIITSLSQLASFIHELS
jgi:putative hydrolase of the HAD superfamily